MLGPVLRLLYRPTVEGIENIPQDGPAILASNHLSFSDSIFLPLMLDRKVVFLAKADYFTTPGAKGKLTALFFKLADQLPIDRSGGRAGDAALRTGLRVLGRGDLLGIYPEGTRSPDGRLYRGKTGVARMALEGLVPVLPVAMVGTDKAQPIGRRIPKIVPITIKIGEPLDFRRYEGMEGDRFILRSITDEIMYRADGALRPGVRRHLRRDDEGTAGGGQEGQGARADDGARPGARAAVRRCVPATQGLDDGDDAVPRATATTTSRREQAAS